MTGPDCAVCRTIQQHITIDTEDLRGLARRATKAQPHLVYRYKPLIAHAKGVLAGDRELFQQHLNLEHA